MVGGGPKRNFQVFSALDFLAEVTQHIPDKGEHLVRYFGWYSHRRRGIREKLRTAGEAEQPTIDRTALDARKGATDGPRPGSVSTWAMLIQRVYEVDPLECPECGGQMKVVSFLEPPQADVIEKILQHCGLWPSSSPRAPPEVAELVLELDAAFTDSSLESADQADPSQELTYVDMDTFLENF